MYAFLFSILIFFQNGQNGLPLTTENLCKKWEFHQTDFLNIVSEAGTSEKNDYFHFKKDHTFAACIKGKNVNGSWKADQNQKVLILQGVNEIKDPKVKVWMLSPDKLILGLQINGREGSRSHFRTTS